MSKGVWDPLFEQGKTRLLTPEKEPRDATELDESDGKANRDREGSAQVNASTVTNTGRTSDKKMGSGDDSKLDGTSGDAIWRWEGERCGCEWRPVMTSEMTHTFTLTIEDAQTRDPSLWVARCVWRVGILPSHDCAATVLPTWDYFLELLDSDPPQPLWLYRYWWSSGLVPHLSGIRQESNPSIIGTRESS